MTKFDYAKEAINLGVERYLTKPIPRAKIIAAVEEAIGKVDAKLKSEKQSLKDSGKTGDGYSGCGEQLCRKSAFSAGNAGGRLLPAASGH